VKALRWVLCAAALSAGSLTAAQAADKNKADECKLGVQLYSFRNDLDRDLPGTLARVKQLGVNCVEPYSLHGRTAEQLRAEFDKVGLRVVSFHLPGELRTGSPAEAVRVAKVLGAKQVGIAWIKETDTDAVTEDKLMAAAKRLNGMCEAAVPAGLKVFYHPHGYEFHEGDPEAQMFDRFVKALRKDCVVLQLDAFWVAYAAQDPVKMLKRYPDRIWSFHVKDMAPNLKVAPMDGSKWGGPLTDEAFATVGQGKIDWNTLLKTAPNAAVRWYIIEDETTQPYDNIKKSLPYLHQHGL